MNAKTILGIMSFVAAVLTTYPTTLWYIGREDKNKEMMKKYEWRMLLGICFAIILYILSLKV